MTRFGLTLLAVAAIARLAGAAPGPASADEFWKKVKEDDKVHFHIYTRDHKTTYKRLENDQSSFDGRRPTVVMAHGYLGCGTAESVQMVRDAVLRVKDVQFVAVHWEQLADGYYEHAAANTTVVAARVAALMDALISGLGARLTDFHLVGFSLGAHVMAQVGRTLKAGPVPRITAVDPARPYFSDLPPEQRLNAEDAQQVVVLHTAAPVIAFAEPLGHVDFFPNNGATPQPACAYEFFPVFCSHMIAPEYLAEAVERPSSYKALRCSSWDDFLGGYCGDEVNVTLGLFHDYPKSHHGRYYLHTRPYSPYGLGDEGATQGRPAFVYSAASVLSSAGLAALLLCVALAAY